MGVVFVTDVDRALAGRDGTTTNFLVARMTGGRTGDVPTWVRFISRADLWSPLYGCEYSYRCGRRVADRSVGLVADGTKAHRGLIFP